MPVDAPPLRLEGAVAVVTGGAGGIGRGIVGALLRRGATAVIADVEAGAVAAAVDDLSPLGDVSGHRVDITDEDAVADLADAVYDAHGRVDLLFNNAGVTSGGGGKPWQQEANDWRWCFGVNVFGMAICTSVFVPRMIAGGGPGQVVNTSSGDGGFAPVPMASVYAASKAAVSCFTESLHHNLVSEGTALRASNLLVCSPSANQTRLSAVSETDFSHRPMSGPSTSDNPVQPTRAQPHQAMLKPPACCR